MINLSDHEREKFATYLMQEAATNNGLIKQMEKLPGMDAMVKLMRTRVAASVFVARELRAIETETIDHPGT